MSAATHCNLLLHCSILSSSTARNGIVDLTFCYVLLQPSIETGRGGGAYHPVRGATDRHREHEYARELAGLFLASRRIDLQQLAVSIPHSYGRSLSLRPSSSPAQN